MLIGVLLLAGCQTAPIAPMTGAEGRADLTAEERRLWHQADELDQQMVNGGYLYKDGELEAYVAGVMRKLYPEYADTIRVRILDSPSLNAFALPNGSVYINTGMLARLDNEAQLATVLAHEGVHFTHKHSWQQQRNVKTSTALSTGFGMVTGIPLLGELVAISSIYGFSKDLEREADADGFARLRTAGYDVSQAPVSFEYLLAEVDALDIDEPYFFSTHPRLQERVESFRQLARQSGGEARYRGEQAYHEQLAKLQLQLLQDYLELGQYQSVLLILERDEASSRYPPSAQFYLGEAYRLRGEEGDSEKALSAYQAALQLAPTFAPTYRALGLYYMKSGQPEQAEYFFGRYLGLRPDAPDKDYIELYRASLKKH